MPATPGRQPQPNYDVDVEGNVNGEGDTHAPLGCDPPAKRRKTRKGTNSCWACKRRKEKCIFERNPSEPSAQAAICLACRRRGTRCVSQEFPEDLEGARHGTHQTGDRTKWIEALVKELVVKLGDNGNSSNTTRAGKLDHGIPTPATSDLESVRNPTSRRTPNSPGSTLISNVSTPNSTRQDDIQAANGIDPGDSRFRRVRLGEADDLHVPSGPAKWARLSQTLYDALPTLRDSEMICQASYRSSNMFTELLTQPYKSLEQYGLGSRENKLELVRPGPHAHPVLLARHMFQLMHLLKQFHTNFEALRGLSEPPEEIMERLADVAMSQVSTQDRLLGSIEGLECVMLESMYHANGGGLRLSWAANRRALHFAQLMGFHQNDGRLRYQKLDPNSRADPQSMWFHIIQYDCSLSLLLGLPRGFQDCNVATEALLAKDISMGRLERIHCVVTSKILDRNDSKRQDFTLTQDLDHALQREARRLPARWWLLPNLANKGTDDESLFWDLKRLIVQISHYNILNRLHLPYMLRASNNADYQYSQIACVNASREILARILVLHEFNRIAFCCRTPDFMALMAAMTLVLAHLDSHHHASSLLVHQYLSDRAMMEQVQQSMESLSRLNGDSLSTQSAELLRRLLIIEAEAAEGHIERTESVTVQPQGGAMPDHEENHDGDGVVRVDIPYFGIVKIAREGTVSTEPIGTLPRSAEALTEPPIPFSGLESVVEATPLGSAFGPSELSQSTQSQTSNSDRSNIQVATENCHFPSVFSQPPHAFCDPCLPGLTAGPEDWTFQGVDMAFFESLASGNFNSDYLHTDGTAWYNHGN